MVGVEVCVQLAEPEEQQERSDSVLVEAAEAGLEGMTVFEEGPAAGDMPGVVEEEASIPHWCSVNWMCSEAV